LLKAQKLRQVRPVSAAAAAKPLPPDARGGLPESGASNAVARDPIVGEVTA
jgi:hypothetical protein